MEEDLLEDQNRFYYLRREIESIISLLEPGTRKYFRKESKRDKKLVKYLFNVEKMREALKQIMFEVYNYDRCFSECKMMYFCELKKGHRGMHRETGLGWPNKRK